MTDKDDILEFPVVRTHTNEMGLDVNMFVRPLVFVKGKGYIDPLTGENALTLINKES